MAPEGCAWATPVKFGKLILLVVYKKSKGWR